MCINPRRIMSRMSLNEDLNIIQRSQSYLHRDNFNDIIGNLADNKISKVLVNTNYRQVVTVDTLPKLGADYLFPSTGDDIFPQNDILYNHYHIASIDPAMVPTLIQKTADSHVPIYFANFTPETMLNIQKLATDFLGIVSYAMPIFILWAIFASFNNIRNVGNSSGGMTPFGIGKDQAMLSFNRPNVSLLSWAGSPEVIEECKEVISYLENKEIYQRVGAVMPKGILLEGPPGTGKTLLAKAIATETNSTFISKSGSEFVELFVGMGAAKVRALFETARQNTPCIIFIDEIDAVGRQRGASANQANDEREQTLNQILYEMDGFNNNEDIVVMAATNRKDILDKALLRPGRFDRIIRIPLPDQDSRKKILESYLKTKTIEPSIDIDGIAEMAGGLSGAELKNLVNEAAIMTAKNNETVIREQFILDAYEKSIVGLIRRNATTSSNTKQRVAIHEIGHTLMALKYPEYFDFKKVSIQPTYNGAGGYTIFTEKPEIREGGLYTKDILRKRLAVILGGKAAEWVYYGADFVSLGATQDLNQANRLSKRMISNFGMGEYMEVFHDGDIEESSNPFLRNGLSENTKMVLDKESLVLVKRAFQEAKDVLYENREVLIQLADELKKKSVLYSNDFVEVTLK